MRQRLEEEWGGGEVDQMRRHRRVLVPGKIDRHFASYDAAGLTAHNLIVNCIKVHTRI